MKREKISKQMYIDWFSVAPGVWRIKDLFVNMYLIHNPSNNKWVLLDTGLSTSANKIKKVAEHLFWPESHPAAIVLLTPISIIPAHLRKLADEWDVPIYAHSLEKPYLTGASSYPPPDPSVGGGLMSLMSFVYPKRPIDVSDRLVILPEDGTIPVLPGWRYYHTPGHAPGHISLFRQSDRLLLAGDAFVTTNQESAIAAITQTRVLCMVLQNISRTTGARRKGLLKYLPLSSRRSLLPAMGSLWRAKSCEKPFITWLDNFRELAVPRSGRYVDEPALVNQEGVQYVPPSNNRNLILAVAGITAAAVVGFLIAKNRKRLSF